MLNLETLGFRTEKELKTRTGNVVQPSGQSTKDKFISALSSGEWVTCKEVKSFTGFTPGTVSRAAAHLVSEKLIITKVTQNGRIRAVFYKLA